MLAQLRAAGVRWEDVSKKIYLLCPSILPPEAAIAYKRRVKRNKDWHPDFIDTYDWFVPVADQWYPNWPDNMVTMSVSFALYVNEAWQNPSRTSWHPTDAPIAPHISFWGADDCGMEMDIGLQNITSNNSDSLDKLESIIVGLPPILTKGCLKKIGFVRA